MLSGSCFLFVCLFVCFLTFIDTIEILNCKYEIFSNLKKYMSSGICFFFFNLLIEFKS